MKGEEETPITKEMKRLKTENFLRMNLKVNEQQGLTYLLSHMRATVGLMWVERESSPRDQISKGDNMTTKPGKSSVFRKLSLYSMIEE